VQFVVSADGATLFDSGIVKGGDAAKAVDVSLAGKRELRLFVDAGGDSTLDDSADWAEARVTCHLTMSARISNLLREPLHPGGLRCGAPYIQSLVTRQAQDVVHPRALPAGRIGSLATVLYSR